MCQNDMLFLIMIVLLQKFSLTECNNRMQNVIGGDVCPITKHPYLVTIHDYYYKHICGGTLIQDKWVLTAAHCCKKHLLYKEYTVYAGVSFQKELTETKSIVLKNYIHPEFSMRNLVHDICLLKLEHAIPEDNIIKHVKLANSSNVNHTLCSLGVSLGFGLQNKIDLDGRIDYTIDHKLHCVSLNASLDEAQCLLQHAIIYSGTKFCSPSEESGLDVCKGDSGGPFMCENVQFGIVSSGVGCGLKNYAGTFVNVLRYSNFIQETIEKNKSNLIKKRKLLKIFLVIILICIIK